PYTYLWDNSAITQDLSNLVAGTYNATITDANNCTLEISVEITEPLSNFNMTAIPTDVSCHGDSDGAIDLTVSGGTPDYSYAWSYNGITTQDLTNVPAGTYTVTVTDENGCTGTISA